MSLLYNNWTKYKNTSISEVAAGGHISVPAHACLGDFALLTAVKQTKYLASNQVVVNGSDFNHIQLLFSGIKVAKQHFWNGFIPDMHSHLFCEGG